MNLFPLSSFGLLAKVVNQLEHCTKPCGVLLWTSSVWIWILELPPCAWTFPSEAHIFLSCLQKEFVMP